MGHPYDFVSRVFAPKAGVDEDPVTGSSYTVLAPQTIDRASETGAPEAVTDKGRRKDTTQYVRTVDRKGIAARGERGSQQLLDRMSGATSCGVSYIRTPAGGGSPDGLHTHTVDQALYVLEAPRHPA